MTYTPDGGKPNTYAPDNPQNPRGPVRGSVNVLTSLKKETARYLFSQSAKLLEKAFMMAMEGDTKIMCKLLDKILPSPKEIDVTMQKSEELQRDMIRFYDAYAKGKSYMKIPKKFLAESDNVAEEVVVSEIIDV